MLVVGENSFVTLTEAKTYVSTHYRASETNRTFWDGLDDSEKTIVLLRACQSMLNLPYIGRKSNPSQTLPFPRFPEVEVDTTVKYAQIEEALYNANPTVMDARANYEDLISRGVLRYGIGNFSERFANNFKGATGLCYKAGMLLTRYLAGGYAIC